MVPAWLKLCKRNPMDPLPEKKRPWGLYGIFMVIIPLMIEWTFGKFYRIFSPLSPKITNSWVIHQQLPPQGEAVPTLAKSLAEKKNWKGGVPRL